ncbi:MAG: phage major capsid protein [Clostridia bacterium]|nr:phage major capsid protein [Clostridia bacterium]
MANVLSKGALFPPLLTNELINKVRGKSSLAALSESEPVRFNGTSIFTFSLDKEVDLVAENGSKSNGGATVGTISMAPVKIEYGARVSDEFVRASEEVQLQYLRAFAEGFARKAARGLDIMAFHGYNPRTGSASTVIGTNHMDSQVVQTETFNGSTPDANIENAIALIEANEHEVTGLAMSPAMRAALAAMKRGSTSNESLFPELAWGSNPGTIRGLRADTNSTVSFNSNADRAVVGNFRDFFRWGYAAEIPLEVIEYGNPDNDADAGDLKGHNQVYLRAEAYIGWAILDPSAFARVVANPSVSLTVAADVPAGTDLLGKSVTDLQDGVWIGPEQITGSLKHVTGYTGFSGDPAEQSGHYLVTHSTAAAGATIKAELIGGTTGEVTLDPDGILISRITSTDQKLKITASKDGTPSTVKIYDLSALVLED